VGITGIVVQWERLRLIEQVLDFPVSLGEQLCEYPSDGAWPYITSCPPPLALLEISMISMRGLNGPSSLTVASREYPAGHQCYWKHAFMPLLYRDHSSWPRRATHLNRTTIATAVGTYSLWTLLYSLRDVWTSIAPLAVHHLDSLWLPFNSLPCPQLVLQAPEPSILTLTMKLYHGKHLQTYVASSSGAIQAYNTAAAAVNIPAQLASSTAAPTSITFCPGMKLARPLSADAIPWAARLRTCAHGKCC